MARPKKTGLDYFSLDIDFFENKKILRLKRKCGWESVSILLYLWTMIYKDKGYYIDFDDDLCLSVSEKFNVTEENVTQIIRHSVEVNLFNKEQFFANKILTSKEILERYKMSTLKREDVFIEKRYEVSAPETGVSDTETGVSDTETGVSAPEIKSIILPRLEDLRKSVASESDKKLVSAPEIGVSAPEIGVSAPEIGVSGCRSTQSKVKESKEEKSKEESACADEHGCVVDNQVDNGENKFANKISEEPPKHQTKNLEKMIVKKMLEIWLEKFPDYLYFEQTDKTALLEIAYLIAGLKKIPKHEVIGVKEDEIFWSWKKVVEFLQTQTQNQFFKKLTIHGISIPKNFQSILTEMTNQKNQSSAPQNEKPEVKSYNSGRLTSQDFENMPIRRRGAHNPSEWLNF